MGLGIGTGNAPRDKSHTLAWREIDWAKVKQKVKEIQIRIAKATSDGRWRDVHSLQRLLVRSYSARLLAVRHVTEKKGRRTPGVDGQRWSTPEAKVKAAARLAEKGHRAKPLKRVYIPKAAGQGRRPLGIPCMLDRARQALYALALEPAAETRADRNSYGFRRMRSVQDAMSQCQINLARKCSARYVLKADIEGCFDNISHAWILKHVPLPKKTLKQWLKAGFLEKQTWHLTEAGVPQGACISPCITNWVLDGLERRLTQSFPKHTSKVNQRVNMIRYVDDSIVTGKSMPVLKQEVIPRVAPFLLERGLGLSPTKTKVAHVKQGFEFLGRQLRKNPQGMLLIRPSKVNLKGLKRKVAAKLRKMTAVTQAAVIQELAPILNGWANAFQHDNSKKVFNQVDEYVWKKLWRWARRRHLNKGAKWVLQKYFRSNDQRNYIFACPS